MKRLTTLVVLGLVLVSTQVFAQSPTIENFIDKFKSEKGARHLTIGGFVIKLASFVAKFNDSVDGKALSRITSNINGMSILLIPHWRSNIKQDDIKKLNKNLHKEKYDELVIIREKGVKINILAQGESDELRNIVILIEDNDDFVLLDIDGTLNMKDLAYLSNNHDNWH